MRVVAVLVTTITCAFPLAVLGGKVEFAARSTVSTSPHGNYYIIEFDLPQSISSVRHAWLEAYVDVSLANEELPDAAPMLDVYVLKRTLSGEPTPSDFETTRIPLSRPIALGANRLMRIDISEFAKTILAEPGRNHGLVIGSLSGARTGNFALRSDGFGPGVPVRVSVIQ